MYSVIVARRCSKLKLKKPIVPGCIIQIDPDNDFDFVQAIDFPIKKGIDNDAEVLYRKRKLPPKYIQLYLIDRKKYNATKWPISMSNSHNEFEYGLCVAICENYKYAYTLLGNMKLGWFPINEISQLNIDAEEI